MAVYSSTPPATQDSAPQAPATPSPVSSPASSRKPMARSKIVLTQSPPPSPHCTSAASPATSPQKNSACAPCSPPISANTSPTPSAPSIPSGNSRDLSIVVSRLEEVYSGVTNEINNPVFLSESS